jgi:hypothetical protein
MNTANEVLDPRIKLKPIPEEDAYHKQQRDKSSSEKPPAVHSKLLNDTILEERESPLREYDESSQEGNAPTLQEMRRQREQRRGIMSKLSKKMARDYLENKKSFSGNSAGMSSQQISDQRLREEHQDKTVYKITKPKSPGRLKEYATGKHNLST